MVGIEVAYCHHLVINYGSEFFFLRIYHKYGYVYECSKGLNGGLLH